MRKILFFPIAVVFSLLFLIQGVHATWWNTTWDYKRLMNVTNAQASYQIPLNLTYNTHYKTTDCSDIRFTNSSEDEELDYWVENKTTSSWCYVWVEARQATNFYLYYGNTTPVSSASNITNTFIYGIDWTAQTSLPTTWLNTTNVAYTFNSATGITLTFVTDSWTRGIYLNSVSFTPSFAVRTVGYTQNSGLGWSNGITTAPNSTNCVGGNGNNFEDKSISSFWTIEPVTGGVPATGSNGGTSVTNTLYNAEAIYKTGNVERLWIQGKGYIINRTDATQSPVKISYGAYFASTTLKMKQTVVRKYAEPEPTYSIGAEEEPADTTAPTYSLNSTNSTLIGTFISHNLYWNDDTALHTKGQYRAWFDNCTGVFANVTPLTNFTTTPQWTNFTVKINTTSGCTIRWFVNATDNVGNINNTGTTTPFSYVTTSPPDTTAPTYALNSTNSTLKGTPIQFSLNWTDETALSMAITGLWNGSAWTNATSWCDLSPATWCNQTLVVNFTAQQLWWRGYANDSSGNWNGTENFSLITTSPPKDKIAPSILDGLLDQFLPDVMAMEPTFQKCYNNTHLLVNKDLTLEYDANESVITQTYYRYCEHGCDNTTDTCSPISAFNLNFLIIGAFVVAWIVLGIFYYFTRRMPLIKHFMWFFVIIGMVVLLFYAPYPTYLTAQQLDIAQIFTIITLLFSVAMFVLG